ncbi:MAG: dTDP-4-dehydrorhamnose 3,5-epimerase [Candidatus Niyogibacteria bacterium CG10_big_fil_rev_8_21_14_0_10_46_36]|uniref:dTDP-4-dehydrorhamnose 3,5-epimerase n=1 Tax=Candidatus Niyogibacteria bacterium CG10_big_fil_rev_8_21_14_0_10_46_36 TaxID=1974726 RepID=A0A2H0TEG8_9BACT|nr:MAG: dTDP-4-dehydrorhamnose 3,5-epimerase [Candidatus Niyogibacteria bacterium CG10_big_fil_rev_8_21_14_0_10_46_36]
MIEGVRIISLKKFPDERGAIMHGVRKDTILNDFGEVYFKKLYKDIINGWHVHESLILNYICIHGAVKLVLHDMRPDSPTYRQFEEVYFGDDNYCLVHIPPGIANASKGIAAPFSIMCNIASEPHNPDIRYTRIDPLSGEIPYDWSRKHY